MSSLQIGIVGLPNVGKSTLFNALTDNNILAANYPFATIEPNTGIVPVPDDRLAKLSALYSNAPIKPAVVEFVDIAGLVAGASQGEGLGNQFLANIRSTNAIAHVVRAFDDPNVQHVSDTPQGTRSSEVADSVGQQTGVARALKDIEIINTELVLADLQTVEKRLPRIEKEARANPKLRPLVDTYKKIRAALDQGKLVSTLDVDPDHLRDLQLITAKPIIYVFNVDEDTLTSEDKKAQLSSLAKAGKAIFICAKLESEVRGLDENDRLELLKSYGSEESGLIQLIHAAYDTLRLQSYLTAGEKEVRAWTIKKGSTAPQAAGVIHGDFERGFIAAQVVDYDDLIEAGSESAAKAVGKVRTEGKAYIMQPNDVVEFRFNV